jgi:Trk K+ transport system NAD-binding subunit
VLVPEAWRNLPVTSVCEGNAVVCAIERGERAFVPRADERLQPNDIAVLSIPATLLPQLLNLAMTRKMS